MFGEAHLMFEIWREQTLVNLTILFPWSQVNWDIKLLFACSQLQFRISCKTFSHISRLASGLHSDTGHVVRIYHPNISQLSSCFSGSGAMTSWTGWASPRGRWSPTPGSTVSGPARWGEISLSDKIDSLSKNLFVLLSHFVRCITTFYSGIVLRPPSAGLGADLPDTLLRADWPRWEARVSAGRVPGGHLAHLHHAPLPAIHPPRLLQVAMTISSSNIHSHHSLLPGLNR